MNLDAILFSAVTAKLAYVIKLLANVINPFASMPICAITYGDIQKPIIILVIIAAILAIRLMAVRFIFFSYPPSFLLLTAQSQQSVYFL